MKIKIYLNFFSSAGIGTGRVEFRYSCEFNIYVHDDAFLRVLYVTFDDLREKKWFDVEISFSAAMQIYHVYHLETKVFMSFQRGIHVVCL